MGIIGKKHCALNSGGGGNDAIGKFPFGIPAAKQYGFYLALYRSYGLRENRKSDRVEARSQ